MAAIFWRRIKPTRQRDLTENCYKMDIGKGGSLQESTDQIKDIATSLDFELKLLLFF